MLQRLVLRPGAISETFEIELGKLGMATRDRLERLPQTKFAPYPECEALKSRERRGLQRTRRNTPEFCLRDFRCYPSRHAFGGVLNDPYAHHLIVNGRLAGSWTRTLTGKTVVVTVALYKPLTVAETRLVAAAARRLSAFLEMPVAMHIRPEA